MHVWFLYLHCVLCRYQCIIYICMCIYIMMMMMIIIIIRFLCSIWFKYLSTVSKDINVAPCSCCKHAQKSAGIVCHPHYESAELRERCFWAEKLHGHRSHTAGVQPDEFLCFLFCREKSIEMKRINIERLYDFLARWTWAANGLPPLRFLHSQLPVLVCDYT